MPKTTTAKDIQKNYRRVFDYVKKTQKPVMVMRNNKVDVIIMDAKKLEEMEALLEVIASREETKQGKAKVLKNLAELWDEAKKS